MTPEPGADAHSRMALIRSIVSHSKDDSQALDEVRAVIAGAGIDELLTLRGGAA